MNDRELDNLLFLRSLYMTAPTRWYHGHEDEIRQLITNGVSASVIATQFPGCPSRNAVIGLAHHREWAFKTRPKNLVPKQRARHPSERVVVRKRRASDPPAANDLPKFDVRSTESAPYSEVQPRFSFATVPMTELTGHQCRWIDGEPVHDAPCCGAPTDDWWVVTPFCPAHDTMAYNNPQTRAQRAENTRAWALKVRLNQRAARANT